mgnify:CR=1 FL=1
MKFLSLSRGLKAIIDDKDYGWASKFKWHVAPNGRGENPYVTRKARLGDKWTHLKLHRELMGAKQNEVVDHINGDVLDNRRENLRVCTQAENSRNRRRNRNSISKYKGVTYSSWAARTNRKPWHVRINVNGCRKTIGWYETEEAACQAYKEASKKFYGEFARFDEVV